MADASDQRQCAVFNELEMCMETVQSLVKGHGNSAFALAISGYAEKIRQLVNDERSQLNLSPSSLAQQESPQPADEIAVNIDSREKALNNSVVLRTIMNHLDVGDLLRIRLLAKKWEEEATSKLLSTRQEKELCSVTFYWVYTEHKFANDTGSLQELTESCYSNLLRKFPCSSFNFYLHNPNTKEVPADLSAFMVKCGHLIKSLTLQFPAKSGSLKMVRKIILEWTPNLRSLTIIFNFANFLALDIEDGPDSDHEHQTSPSYLTDLQELNLKRKDFYEFRDCNKHEICKPLVRDILSSAPNLKLISDPHLWFTEEIVSVGKIGAVHSLNWDYGQFTLSHFAEFARTGPQLTFLQVNAFLPSTQLILKSSQKTLKTLHCSRRLTDNENVRVNIPIMGNVEELCLEDWVSVEGDQGRILPLGFFLQTSFPRLKILHVQGMKGKEAIGGSPFGDICNSSTTVERLTIIPDEGDDHSFNPEWLRQAIILYPNVRILNLNLEDWEDFPKICDTIWKCWSESSLEELSISPPWWCDSWSINTDDGNFAQSMDKAFTGFDPKSCIILRKQPGSECGPLEPEFERGPSILDMKKLKLFQLTDIGYAWNGFPLFSRVSVIHAFEPMRRRQNLRVLINGNQLTQMIQHCNVDFGLYCFGKV